MKLHHVNLLGVLIVTAICVGQWRRDRALNLEVNQLERTRHEQASRLVDQEKLLGDANADLTQFKEQFNQSKTELKDTREKLRIAERDFRQLTLERDQLRISVTNWAAAVILRDERLKESAEQTRRLSGELNGSIRKFNELAGGLDNTRVVCVSNDLPFAMARFCGAEGIANVVTLSTMRGANFAQDYGVAMKTGPLAGVTARAVVVLDADDNVVHSELVPEIRSEPNYDAALAALK